MKKKNVSEKPSNFLNVFGYEDGIISDVTILYEGGIILQILTLLARTSQTGQTHSNNSSAFADEF